MSKSSTRDYMTVQNMQECEQVFKQYMLDAHGIDLSQETPRVKRVLLRIMTDVVQGNKSIGVPHANIARMSLHELNNLTLNIARDVIISTSKKESSERPRDQPEIHNKRTASFDVISREQQVCNQQQAMMVPRPVISSNLRAEDGPDLQRTLERILSERGPSAADQVQTMVPILATVDPPLDADSFAKRLADMEVQRSSIVVADDALTGQQDVVGPDAQQLFQNDRNDFCPDSLAIYKAGMADLQAFKIQEEQRSSQEQPLGSSAFITPPNATSMTSRFLTLAGFDRNWTVDPHRYMHTIALQDVVKSIVSLSTTCVIIPMDATRMAPSATVAGSIMHSTECIFAHPYLLLNIDDMTVCEGTNDAVRRSFAVLKFDTSYRSSNGRGYIVLVPVQNETKTFHPMPLASLSSLRLSLRRPNGMLLSNARDDYRIEKIEYEAFNRIYLKIVTDKYFDRNEFYQGDSVYFRGFTPSLSSPIAATTSSSTLLTFTTFMNRPEGHDIVEIGQANDNSFYRTFYILAPGILDQDAGRVEVDADVTTLVQAMNSTYPDSSFSGAIINASLQMVVSMQVKSSMGSMSLTSP